MSGAARGRERRGGRRTTGAGAGIFLRARRVGRRGKRRLHYLRKVLEQKGALLIAGLAYAACARARLLFKHTCALHAVETLVYATARDPTRCLRKRACTRLGWELGSGRAGRLNYFAIKRNVNFMSRINYCSFRRAAPAGKFPFSVACERFLMPCVSLSSIF